MKTDDRVFKMYRKQYWKAYRTGKKITLMNLLRLLEINLAKDDAELEGKNKPITPQQVAEYKRGLQSE